MESSLVLCLAVLALATAQQFDQNTVSVPSNEFLERLRQWQIAFSTPGVQQPESPAPENKNFKYGVAPPTGPISIPPPPHYQPQPHPPNYPPPQGGYYPPQNGGQPSGGYFPPGPPGGQQTGGYYPNPPTPKPTLPPVPPTLPPTKPPVTRPPPPVNPLSKYCLKPRGQFPSKACNKYVNCWDDTVIEQECPAGLYFSEAGYCDYPENVDCSRRTTPPPTKEPPTMPSGQGYCPTLYGYYRDSKNCSQFYVCVGGTPVKFECPPTLVFNTEHGVCDYSYNVPSCPLLPITGGPAVDPGPVYPPVEHPILPPGHPPIYQPQPPTYRPPPPTYAPPPTTYPTYPPAYNLYGLKQVPAGLVDEESRCTEGALHRLNPDCSQVSLCRDGKTEVINCGQGRAYDNVLDRCVPQHQARC